MRHPLTSAQQQLGGQTDKYWAAFARTGNPNVKGQESWPRVTPGADPVLGLHPGGSTVSTTAFLGAHQCDFWGNP